MIHPQYRYLLPVIVLLTMGQFWQDRTSRKNNRGNELYGQKQYQSALQEYLDAQDGDTHHRQLSYNIGNTLYRQQKYSQALKAFEKALAGSDPKLQQQIHFNRGNAFFRMEQYPQAIESYKHALELAPDDFEAKHNLELALKKAEQRQQEQQKKQDQPDKENQNPENGSENQDRESKPDRQDPSQAAQKQPPPSNPEERQSTPQKGKTQTMDKAQAQRLLDALLSEEKEEQRRQALRLQRQKRSGKDW